MKKSVLVSILVGMDLVFLTTLSHAQENQVELTMSVMSRGETPDNFIARLDIESVLDDNGDPEDFILLTSDEALQLGLAAEVEAAAYTGVNAFTDLLAFNSRALYDAEDQFEPLPITDILPEEVADIVDDTLPIFDPDLFPETGVDDDTQNSIDDVADVGNGIVDGLSNGTDDVGDGSGEVTDDLDQAANDADDLTDGLLDITNN